MPAQLVLPLVTDPSFGREDFIVSPANAEAVAFIDAYPNWAAPMAALHGPSGSGKTHLARAWAARAQAHILDAAVLDDAVAAANLPAGPLAVENVDDSLPVTRDSALFTLTERGTALLFTGREPPVRWPVHLPDLASRFRALLAFPLWAPDDGMLAALAQKLAGLGYAGSHDHSASDQKQFVITGWTTQISMDDQTVLDWTGSMCDLGHEHDCEFDGWGTNPKQP